MRTQKTIEDVKSILANVQYKGWRFKVTEGAGGFLLRIVTSFDDQINAIATQYGTTIAIKEWYLSSWCTDTEVVRTAYKAVMYIEEFMLSCTPFLDESQLYDRMANASNLSDLLKAFQDSFKYKNWALKFESRDGGSLVQLVFMAADNENPNELEEQHCRKFFVKDDATADDVFFTVIYAVQTAERHECDEQFTYKNHTIYNPHLDMDAMVDFVSSNAFDRR